MTELPEWYSRDRRTEAIAKRRKSGPSYKEIKRQLGESQEALRVARAERDETRLKLRAANNEVERLSDFIGTERARSLALLHNTSAPPMQPAAQSKIDTTPPESARLPPVFLYTDDT